MSEPHRTATADGLGGLPLRCEFLYKKERLGTVIVGTGSSDRSHSASLLESLRSIRDLHFRNSRRVTCVPQTSEPFPIRRFYRKVESAYPGQSGEEMFSLRETESGKFIYRCHGCGWERELTAAARVAAADEALACNKSHKCSTELPSPKAS